MIYKFKTKYLRISPRKIRVSLFGLKNETVDASLESLQLRPGKAAEVILKNLRSAAASLENQGAERADLKIVNILVDDGPRLKRRLIKPRGRADLIKKRMSHLTIVLKDKKKKRKVDQKEKI